MEHKWSTDSLDEKYVVIPSFPKVRGGGKEAPCTALRICFSPVLYRQWTTADSGEGERHSGVKPSQVFGAHRIHAPGPGMMPYPAEFLVFVALFDFFRRRHI